MKALVPGYGERDEPAVREKSGRVAGAVGIATNLLLFAIKLLAGFLSGSVAVMADAVNNLTDSGSSIVMLVGFKLAGKPADEKHPFGHARIEYLSGVIVSFIVLFLGLQLGMTSVQKILAPQPADFSALALGILGVSVLIKLWQCFFYRSVGRTIHSDTVFATSSDSRNDAIATTVVLLGGYLLGPGWGALAGSIGPALADVLLGLAHLRTRYPGHQGRDGGFGGRVPSGVRKGERGPPGALRPAASWESCPWWWATGCTTPCCWGARLVPRRVSPAIWCRLPSASPPPHCWRRLWAAAPTSGGSSPGCDPRNMEESSPGGPKARRGSFASEGESERCLWRGALGAEADPGRRPDGAEPPARPAGEVS